MCFCSGAGAAESGPGGGEAEVWGGGDGAEGRAGAYQTVQASSLFTFLHKSVADSHVD